MARKSETVLLALTAGLEHVGLSLRRNDPVPAEMMGGAVIILHDGDPGEPEVTLSPLMYHYEHLADLDVIVSGADRDTVFDGICQSISSALAADRTLGGLCDWIEARAPKPSDLYVAGGAAIKAATIQILLVYSTSDPLA